LVIIFKDSLIINIKFSVKYTLLNIIINLFMFVIIVVLHCVHVHRWFSSLSAHISRQRAPSPPTPRRSPTTPHVHRFLASPPAVGPVKPPITERAAALHSRPLPAAHHADLVAERGHLRGRAGAPPDPSRGATGAEQEHCRGRARVPPGLSLSRWVVA
jgi:hypothetical protein